MQALLKNRIHLMFEGNQINVDTTVGQTLDISEYL
tara:strand:- start:146 stop:250 length:105 start_codon:yes stop_codon:yes gene_type:complete